MTIRIAVLTDLHYEPGSQPVHPDRQSHLTDVLLLRAVHRLNRMVRPDVVLVLGDLLNDPEHPDAPEHLQVLRETLDLLHAPRIVLPGNHDPAPEVFFRAMGPPPEWLDVRGVRFVPFADPDEPGYNASRPAPQLERMAHAAHGSPGPLVTVQHVPLFLPGATDSPYNYVNAETVIAAMRDHGFTLSVSGHYHDGTPVARTDHAAFVTAPALCQSPFRFTETEFDPQASPADPASVTMRHHSLALPPELALCDRHIHTHFAYCNENMHIGRTLELGRLFNLAGLGFSEHGDQLYFSRADESTGAYLEGGLATARPEDFRIDQYFEMLASEGIPEPSRGLEIEPDFDGVPIIRAEDFARTRSRLGGVHGLRELKKPEPDIDRAADEFLTVLRRFLPTGIEVLAHPFRVFRRNRVETPERLFEPVVAMLLEHGVAAEINFHTNQPPHTFFRLCLDAGVPLTFGSDSHNLYEVGEFAPHLEFLREMDCDTPDEVLLPAGPLAEALEAPATR